MTPERFEKMKAVLSRRQLDLTVIMDRVHKTHNLAAIARSADAVGIHEIHAVTSKRSIKLTQKAASGIRKWMKVTLHKKPAFSVDPLLQKGYQIIAADLTDDAVDYREVDYTKPTAILAGSELEGLSDEMRAYADTVVKIPLMGMVQSLNVSVATALILNEAMYQRNAKNMYDKTSFTKEETDKLLFEWSYPAVMRHCQYHNIVYPKMTDEGYLKTSEQKS